MRTFHIPIDEQHEVIVDEQLDPCFFDLSKDDELQAKHPVILEGKIYRASEWLIIEASARTRFTTSCPMCNEPFDIPIELPEWRHQQLLSEISGQTWDVTEALREALLIEVPFFVQCGGSTCRNIQEIEPFIRPDSPHGFQPFAHVLSTLEVKEPHGSPT